MEDVAASQQAEENKSPESSAWNLPLTGHFRENPFFHPNDFDWDRELSQHSGSVNQAPLASPADIEMFRTSVHAAWIKHYEQRGIQFFPLKSYLFQEFVCLDHIRCAELWGDHEPKTVWDCGCGYGSATLPLMKHNPSWRFICTDSCPRAIELLQRDVADRLGSGAQGKLEFGVLDASCPEFTAEQHRLLPAESVDRVLLVFVISTMTEDQMSVCLRHIRRVLKSNAASRLVIRDYGFLDEKQFKYEGKCPRIGENAYVRHDGTIAVYFSKDQLVRIVGAHGFVVEELEYKTVLVRNRKENLKLHRVFMHAVFRIDTESSQSSS
eukprot:ANDGO_06733.mRNA.1 tRNA(Thr) (cytosine(32)-N(3))-methyltransferase